MSQQVAGYLMDALSACDQPQVARRLPNLRSTMVPSLVFLLTNRASEKWADKVERILVFINQ
jgi:hypothetical protein